jgi:hypothetical protein
MKILSYNSPVVHNLLENRKLPVQFLSKNWEDIYNNSIKNGFSSNYFMYDRTGAIPHFLNIDESHSQIPTGKLTKSFSEVAQERAKYLISLGKQINVSWSGGLDSTFVLFCLYHYAEDKSQINVYGTYNSVIESGYMFDRYIKNRISYTIKVNSDNKNNYNPNDLYVTGQPSNLLFQPSLPYKSSRDTILKIPNTEFITKNADKDYVEILEDSVVKFIQPSVAKIERKIKTLQELRWFINFNFCWHSNAYHHNIGINSQNVIPFFQTDDFQRWSIYNTDTPTKLGDYTDERWQIRELISEFTGDNLYAKNKRKNLSVLSSVDQNWLFLLNDYSNIYLEDLQNPNSLSYK